MRAKAQSAGLDIVVDSAGTGGWHQGDPPDARAIVAARVQGQGYDISAHIARKVSSLDFVAFDLVVVMDEANRLDLLAMRPKGGNVPIVLVSSFGLPDGPREVSDPYYTGKFDPVIKLLETCLDGLIAQLLAERQ